MRVPGTGGDSAWTFTEQVRGRRCVFTFRHGITAEMAEGNVLEAVMALRAGYVDGESLSTIQLATWLAARTSGVASVRIEAVIGHGAVATVVERGKRKHAANQEV